MSASADQTGLAVLLADAAGPHLKFFDSLGYQTAGMLIVIISLGLLAVAIGLVGFLLRNISRLQPPTQAAAPPPSPAPAAQDDAIPEDIRKAIAAAVAFTIGHPHHILQIRPETNVWLQAWSVEGRRQIFQSHQIRR